MLNFLGKPPINPVLFYTGKIAGYLTVIILILYFFGIKLSQPFNSAFIIYFAYFLLAIGFIIVIISFLNLGKSTTVGIPIQNTILKTKALYKYSRNPMYVGAHFLTLSSILITLNIYVIILGIYSIIVYHFIILSEEKFLRKRFDKDYLAYYKRVKRYI
jgi:protein-S-isoprenylcysteine O-methyltransferase Ste14